MKKEIKRIFSLMLTAALLLALLPVTVLAAEEPDLTVEGGTLDTDYTYSGNDLIFQKPGTYTVSMAEGVTSTTALRIVVKNPDASSDPFNITLDGVNIDKVNNNLCAFEIQQPSIVNLTLAGNNYLTSAGNNAGIRCSSGSTLTIGGSGYLQASGGTTDMFGGGAGIGENSYHGQAIGAVSGTINITGGTIDAKGGGGAAGIGGGSATNCGIVNISGGTVTATGGGGSMGGSHGAGIGAGLNFFGDEAYNGHNGNGGTVTISGGIVTASGVNHAAGIGGAYVNSNVDGAKGGTLTVTGGFVEATAGSDKVAAIGGGHGGAGKGGDGADILISGGTVIVYGWIGAGLSTGTAGDPGTCVITGGSLKTDLNGMKPTPTNETENVYLTTLTLENVSAETEVTSLTTDAGSYGTNGMKTDASGQLYLWLPDNTLTTAAQAGTVDYKAFGGEIATEDNGLAAGVLYLDASPAVANVAPSGTGAASSGSFVVTFDKTMNTGMAGMVTLNGTALVGGNWTDARTYTIPYAGLDANTIYTAVISDFQDILDHMITPDTSHSFTTIGGGGDGESDSTLSTPTTPTYNAEVKAGSGTPTTLPVTVDKNSGIAHMDIGSQKLTSGGTVITIPPMPDIDTYSVGIQVPELSTTGEQGTLTFETDIGSITVPSNMLTGASGISGSKAEISIGQGDKDNLPDDVKAALGDKPLIQLTLSIDGKQTDWNNPDAPVTVSIPYTPTAEELANPENIVIWYIDGSGNPVCIPNGHYDPATGMVTFDTTHFSYYAVAYNKMSFNDVVANAWYNKAVSFIAARKITSGMGNGNFSPEAKLSRGQFIVMLMKAYGIAPDANSTDNFADAGNTYYTGYLAAAKCLGISAGVGNNLFVPEKEITRQEMFTLLYNALKVIGQLPGDDSGKTLSDFTDAEQIDAWAKEAMTLLVKTGIVCGSNGKLTPQGTTTRAEMAQVLYNLLGK